MLVLGVLSQQQKHKHKGQTEKGATTEAIEGMLMKNFGGCLPLAAKQCMDDWLAGVLKKMLEEGSIEDVNAEIENRQARYIVATTEKAAEDIKGTSSRLDASLVERQEANKAKKEHALHFKPAKSQKKAKKKQSAKLASTDKMMEAGKERRVETARTAASTRRATKHSARRQQKLTEASKPDS